MSRMETVLVTEYRVAEADNLNVYTGFGVFDLADDFMEMMRQRNPKTRYVLLAVVDA